MSISTSSASVDCSLPPALGASSAAAGLTAAPTDAAAFANLLTAFGPLASGALPVTAPATPLPGDLTFVPTDDAAPALTAGSEESTAQVDPAFSGESPLGSLATGETPGRVPLSSGEGEPVHVQRRMKLGTSVKSPVLCAPHAYRQMGPFKASGLADLPSAPARTPLIGAVSPLTESEASPESSDATLSLAADVAPSVGGNAVGTPAAATGAPATTADPASLISPAMAVAPAPVDEATADTSAVEDGSPAVSRRTNHPLRRSATDADGRVARSEDRPTSTSAAARPALDAAPFTSAGPSSPEADTASLGAAALPTTIPPSPALPPHGRGPGVPHERTPVPVAAEFAAVTGAIADASVESEDAAAAADSGVEAATSVDADPAGAAPVFSATLDVRALPRGVEARSFNARFSRAADSADESVVPSLAGRRSGRSHENNTMLTTKEEGDAKSSSFAGIAAANVTATMIKRAFSPAEQTSVAQAATPVATLSPFLDSQNFEEIVPVAPPMVAVRAVMLAAERAVHAENPSVDLRFDLEGMASLHVRVECRDGVVHTTFRSDSAEMREIISREWAAQTAQAEARGVRLAEPVFNTSTPPRSPDDSPSRQRERRPSRQSDDGAEIVSFNPRRSARGRAAASGANSPLGFHAVA